MTEENRSQVEWLVIPPEDQPIRDELVKILPKPPYPGLSKQQILDAMGWSGHPLAKREDEWRRIYRVILLCRRMVERRQPSIPIIVNTGTTASEPRYQLLGWTWNDGTPAIFNAPIQLSHPLESRLLPEFRTRATAISELVALKYLIAIADAYDKDNKQAQNQLFRAMAQDTLVIVPVFSLMGQLMGVYYQQGRSIPELIQTWKDVIDANPKYHSFLREPLTHLDKALRLDWPRIEKALVILFKQLVPLMVIRLGGAEKVRQALDARANALEAQTMLPPGNP